MEGSRALLVMASRYAAQVWDALESCGVEIDHALNCREAREFLRRGVEVDVVVSDLSLPDGSWWTISRELAQQGHRANLLICAPAKADSADPQPFDRCLGEVITPPFDRATMECILERLGVIGCGVLGVAAGF